MKIIYITLLIVILTLAACTTPVVEGEKSAQGSQEEKEMDHDKMDHDNMGHDMQKEDNDMMDHSMHMMEVTSEASFVIEMIPHHQEAVDTSIIIRDTTQNEQLKELTIRIIEAQEREIAMMNTWVDDWYERYEPTYMNMMPDLESRSGEDKDVSYLKGMIAHHEMAVQMAKDVLELNPRQEVADFANEVIKVQSQEIDEMNELLLQYNPVGSVPWE